MPCGVINGRCSNPHLTHLSTATTRSTKPGGGHSVFGIEGPRKVVHEGSGLNKLPDYPSGSSWAEFGVVAGVAVMWFLYRRDGSC